MVGGPPHLSKAHQQVVHRLHPLLLRTSQRLRHYFRYPSGCFSLRYIINCCQRYMPCPTALTV